MHFDETLGLWVCDSCGYREHGCDSAFPIPSCELYREAPSEHEES